MKEAAESNIQEREEMLDTYIIEIETVESEDPHDTTRGEVTRSTSSNKQLSPYPEDTEKEDDDYYDDPEVGKVPYFQWAETLAIIDNGCWMKVVTGEAGPDASADRFPWYSTSEVYVRLLWDLMPSDWRLVAFLKEPKDAYDPDEYLQAKQILIKDITEVLLETDESVSFRIYLDETNPPPKAINSKKMSNKPTVQKKVVRMTPAPFNRAHAVAWVDAIFATMHLQNEEDDTDNNELVSYEERALMLLDLRDRFYELHPEMKSTNFVATNNDCGSELVVHNANNRNNPFTLGSNSHPDTDDTSNNNKTSNRFSFGLDYSNIYGGHSRPSSMGVTGGERDSTVERNMRKMPETCCVIS
jgi:hypothetical protein